MFGTKKKEIDQLEKLYSSYFDTKVKIEALEAEKAELRDKIIEESKNRNLFGSGKTAKFGLNKVWYTNKIELKKPKNFDLEAFKEDFPSLLTSVPDEKKIITLIDGETDTTILTEKYGFEVSKKQQWTIEKS